MRKIHFFVFNSLTLSGSASFVQFPCSQRRAGLVIANERADVPKHTEINVELLNSLNNCQSGSAARNVLQSALGGDSPLFNSIRILPGVSGKGISDADLAIQTKIRNNRYSILELIDLNGDKDADRTSLALLSLIITSTSSALVANQNLPGPEILRFVVVWILSFAPFIFLGWGVATPEKLQVLLVLIQKTIFPVYRKRMIQHEAGHFLMGHLLGLPIKGYNANAIKNAVEFYPLSDPDVGRDLVVQLGFDVPTNQDIAYREYLPPSNAPYFSKEGRGAKMIQEQSIFRSTKNYTENPFLKVPSMNDPTQSWPYRGFDEETIDKLTVVSVAGVCAEIMAFGNAEGGLADISQMDLLFSSAQSELSERDRQNRLRYAIGYATTQLRLHLGALDALAQAMEQGASLADCVLAIESCGNVRGSDSIMGDYDRRRRDQFRAGGLGMLENLLLGGKNADVEETRIVGGIGGGYKKSKFSITGDDPLYAAICTALIFLTWATCGGLSLH